MIAIRKRYIIILSIVLLISMTCLYSRVHKKAVFAESSSNSQKVTVVIDCGHGGEDGGAVSDNGTIEKNINIDIGITLKNIFLQCGFDVQMIRETDISVYTGSPNTLREKKISDIHNRSDICNSSPNNIYISIHQNKFTESKYHGTQVFYSGNTSESALLAESIRCSVKGLLQNNNERKCKEATKEIYILDKAQVPAVLIECGFLSNPEEEKLLNTTCYKNQLAYSIFCGFLDFYNDNIR